MATIGSWVFMQTASKYDGEMTSEELLERTTKFYVESEGFNGLPVRSLDLEVDELRGLVRPLVESRQLCVNYGDRHPNSSILAFEPEAKDEQLRKLDAGDLGSACLYPTVDHLRTIMDPTDYAGRPYTLELALGHPALGYHFFDLSILETYRNDPRYYYTFDIDGMISVDDEYFDQPTMDERDQVLLQSFGLALAKEKYWAIVVFRRYLGMLSPEHQQLWKTKQEADDAERFQPHWEYWRTSMGEWPEKMSLFTAFLLEMEQVNNLSEAIGRPPLFRNTYHDERPRDFGYLIRPTVRELANFAGVLDKMLSDNINRDFFQNDVPYEDETTDSKGRVVITQRGTIRILDEWIKAKMRPRGEDSRKLLNQAIGTLKEIRKRRNPQAHKLSIDAYDRELFVEQIKLMRDAYRAMVTLRQMLKLHPAARGYEVPEDLQQMKVLDF
jgi:hypothetical protein